MKLRTVIADDERFSRDRLRRFLEREPEVEIVAECATGLEAIEAIHRTDPDVIFLDIRMPDLDGFGVLKALKKRAPAVVFVTAFDEFALKAFDVSAVDYLLKPYDEERFKSALAHARRSHLATSMQTKVEQIAGLLNVMESRRMEPNIKRLTVRAGQRLLLVNSSDIDWASAASNYAELHVGKSSYLWRGTLGALMASLPAGQFVRISRSQVVNIERVKQIRPKSHGDALATLADGKKLLVSRRYRTQIDAFLSL